MLLLLTPTFRFHISFTHCQMVNCASSTGKALNKNSLLSYHSVSLTKLVSSGMTYLFICLISVAWISIDIFLSAVFPFSCAHALDSFQPSAQRVQPELIFISVASSLAEFHTVRFCSVWLRKNEEFCLLNQGSYYKVFLIELYKSVNKGKMGAL